MAFNAAAAFEDSLAWTPANFYCLPARAGGFSRLERKSPRGLRGLSRVVRPAGRTHLGVRVPYTPGKGKC